MLRAKELRKENKLKQIDISERLQINRATYSKQENEEYPMTSTNIVKLAKIYNVTTDYLLGVSDIKNTTSIEDCKKLKNATMAQKEAFDALLELDTLLIGRVLSYIHGLKTMKHHF